MSEEAIVKRLNRAKKAASESLIKTGYKIIPSDNSEFCILGVRKREVRLIRVVVDKITSRDVEIVEGFELPGICTKEIWCRKLDKQDFEIKEIL